MAIHGLMYPFGRTVRDVGPFVDRLCCSAHCVYVASRRRQAGDLSRHLVEWWKEEIRRVILTGRGGGPCAGVRGEETGPGGWTALRLAWPSTPSDLSTPDRRLKDSGAPERIYCTRKYLPRARRSYSPYVPTPPPGPVLLLQSDPCMHFWHRCTLPVPRIRHVAACQWYI